MHRFVLIVCCLLPLSLGEPVGFTMTRGEKRESNYIRFEYVATNINAELDQDLGAFRCNSPGLYYFTFTALSPKRDVLKISLRKNRQAVTTLYASDNAHASVSGSMTLWLIPNDLVYPFIEDGGFHESVARGRALTTFSGFKITGKPRSEMKKDSLLRESDGADSFLADVDPNDKVEELFKSDKSK